MEVDIEALFRLQKGWVEPNALPEQDHSVLFSQKRLFSSMAAFVLSEVRAGILSASDEIPTSQALAQYLNSVQAHFTLENCLKVAAFHGLVGSTYKTPKDMDIITHLDFPAPFAVFGSAGFWNRVQGIKPEASSSLESPANVSQTLAFPQTESATQ
ncbi:MAG: hypothetical protein AAB383_02095 [Patescibacteria group bacterium]